MSKLKFKDSIYTLPELITLRRMSPLYKEGEVCDIETGEIEDLENIDKWRELYIEELITRKEKCEIIKKKDKTDRSKELEDKYNENTITKYELLELIKLKHNRYFEVNYEDYYLINVSKGKPKKLSIVDYGRFIMMLDFMTKKNVIAHKSNGKQIKENELIEYIEIKTQKSFRNLLSKLSKFGMIAKNGYGNKRFIHINPVHAKRRIKIDETIYTLFKEDLQEYLTEYEIKYFEMESTEDDLSSSTFELID
jgi:hypothetical protein